MDVGGFRQKEVCAPGEARDVGARPGVPGIGEHALRRGEPNTRVGHEVRQQPGVGGERADFEPVAGPEGVEAAGPGEHARPVEGEHGIRRPVRGVHRQGRGRGVAQSPRAQQRIEVGAVIRMPVADQHGVDRLGRGVPEQARQGGVSGIDEQAESGVLDEVAAARLLRGGPRAAAAEDRQVHDAGP